ncbi:hypothetical protein RIF29_28453 [Crotalaria pallida]|uniref:DNA-directed RNA polymerase n=1 Tax=Crotalaria pallida TaxID=3830 RepID=A0AAN9ED00_CROPI
MTSVYGVTFIGAREQIKRRLEEKGLITDDKLLFFASCYAAKRYSIQFLHVTLAALGEVFEAACGIMGWLGDCVKVIAYDNQAVLWTIPFGIPVVQPYCKTERHLHHVTEKKEEQPTAMNAFELISMSKGLNLENLFDEQGFKRETRFISKPSAKEIINRIEEVAKLLGFNVQKKNYKHASIGMSVTLIDDGPIETNGGD